MNFDEIRVGRTLEVQAQRYAEQQVKAIDDPDEADRQFHVIFSEQHAKLVRDYNRQKINQLPATSLMVNDDNRDVPVIRYSLKPGVSLADALATLQSAQNAVTSPDFDGKEETIDNHMKQSFVIHQITHGEAAERPELKQNPYDLLNEAALKQVEQANDNQKKVNDEVDSKTPPFAIPGDQLTARLEEKGLTPAEFGKSIEIHFMTVKKWMNKGVPQQYSEMVFEALK